MPFAFHRWLARHPAGLRLVLVLSLVLATAQTFATFHEFTHGLPGAAPVTHLADRTSGPGRPAGPDLPHGRHDCPLCLLAAALGDAATAPPAPTLAAADFARPVPAALPPEVAARSGLPYRSRGPPEGGLPA